MLHYKATYRMIGHGFRVVQRRVVRSCGWSSEHVRAQLRALGRPNEHVTIERESERWRNDYQRRESPGGVGLL